MRSTILSLIAVLAGCTSESGDANTHKPAEVTLYRSGTRLRARVLTAAGGAKLFRGFRDTALGMDCLVGKTPGGAQRCVPPSVSSVLYSDASCSTRVIVRRGSCAEPAKFATDSVQGTCGEVDVYEAGAAIAGAKLFTNTGAACSPVFDPEVTEVFAATKVDPERLAKFTEQDVALGGLKVTIATSGDGAQAISSTRLISTDERCTIQSFGLAYGVADPIACVPGGAYVMDMGGYFADAACTERAAYTFASACSAPPKTAVVFGKPGGCGAVSVDYHALGEELSSSFLIGDGGTCAAAMPPADGRQLKTFKLGPKFELSQFPSIKRVDRGDGRLRSIVYTTEGKTIGQYESRFVDGDGQCSPEVFVDGVERCVDHQRIISSSKNDQPLFADAMCTKRLYRAPSGECAQTPTHIILQADTTCGFRYEKVHKLGAKFTGTEYYFGDATNPALCNRATVGTDSFYELGDEVAPDSAWEKVTTVVE